jgi:hypothetical protein
MDSVLPNVEPYSPKTGQKVSIYVGDPLILDDYVENMKKENRSSVCMNKSFIEFAH